LITKEAPYPFIPAVLYNFANRLMIQCDTGMIAERNEEIWLSAFIAGEQRERARIGRELHDGIGAMLFTIGRQLQHFAHQYPDTGTRRMIDGIQALVQEAVGELSNTLQGLIPETLALHGLEAALQRYNRQLHAGNPPWTQVHCYGSWAQVDPALLQQLFRISQELLHNMVQHAQASGGTLTLDRRANHIRIFAEDNGCGFVPGALLPGTGLGHLQARIRLLKGEMHLDSAPGKGTAITIIINT